jgi:histidine triad (HIT) family protein
MSESTDCIFCKIANGKIASKKHFENDEVFAIEDIRPASPTHLLFIPKEHIESINHVKDPKIIATLFSAISKYTRDKGIQGFRTIINTGEEGGQTVFHLHVHVLAGKKMSAQMT